MAFVGSEIWKQLPNEKLQTHFLQTTRGDAIYIKTPHGKEILIDGGVDRKILSSLSQYRPFWDRYIDVIIITHPDSDHYYGALEVIKRFEVGKIFLTGVLKNDPKYIELFDFIEQKNIEVIFASSRTDFFLDGVDIDFIYPFESLLGDTQSVGNNFSLVFFLKYHGKKILFTGDIETATEEKILRLGIDLTADILKIPHHGSKSSSSQNFLEAVKPSRTIVQVGTENSFGHPHQEIIERYHLKSLPLESTRQGDIVVEW